MPMGDPGLPGRYGSGRLVSSTAGVQRAAVAGIGVA